MRRLLNCRINNLRSSCCWLLVFENASSCPQSCLCKSPWDRLGMRPCKSSVMYYLTRFTWEGLLLSISAYAPGPSRSPGTGQPVTPASGTEQLVPPASASSPSFSAQAKSSKRPLGCPRPILLGQPRKANTSWQCR